MVANENTQSDGPEAELSQPEPVQWSNQPESQRRRVEAVLFFSAGPLTTRKIAALAGLDDGTQARTIIRHLNQCYNEQNRAFHIKRIAGGYQLFTRPQFSKWLRRLEHIPRPTRLSSPAMETLTVVAYRQPIIKADIEAVRGVSCGEMLRQLLERGFVKISGRSEELGRPYLYSTTRDFLVHFGLNSLEQLPRFGRLVGEGLPSWAEDNKKPSSERQLADEHNDS
ncbi:MAG: SMC-Scp complex subunit ScpB [Mariniblastus sp.]|nr:SMC-Scp complex subunit ScpB [Mariniblastus sp.]